MAGVGGAWAVVAARRAAFLQQGCAASADIERVGEQTQARTAVGAIAFRAPALGVEAGVWRVCGGDVAAGDAGFFLGEDAVFAGVERRGVEADGAAAIVAVARRAGRAAAGVEAARATVTLFAGLVALCALHAWIDVFAVGTAAGGAGHAGVVVRDDVARRGEQVAGVGVGAVGEVVEGHVRVRAAAFGAAPADGPAGADLLEGADHHVGLQVAARDVQDGHLPGH